MSLSAKTFSAALLFFFLLLPAAALAQRATEGGLIQRQSPRQQLAAVEVGDSVAVILDEVSYRRVRGTVADHDTQRIRLTAPNGSRRTFDRDIIYAVIGTGQDARAQRREMERENAALADFSRGKLLMFPTARVSKPGQGTVFNSQVFLPYLSYSLPAFPLEVRAGSSVLPMTAQEMFAGLKVPLFQRRLDEPSGRRLTISAGGFGAVSTNYWTVDAKDEIGGVVFGLATYDLRASKNKSGERSGTTAITAGAGYVASGGIVGNSPALMGGFEHRGGGRYKFLSEVAYLPASSDVLGTVGLRYLSRRVTVDGGFMTGTPLAGLPLPVVPLVSFGYRLF